MSSSAVELEVRAYLPEDLEEVVGLWQVCFPDDPPWNEPRTMVRRKLGVQPELFLVGLLEGRVAGTVLGGFDGVRGWVYHLAVAPEFRRKGYGRALMAELERRLAAIGCPKVNLQVRATNEVVIGFYRELGYASEDRASLGKRLIAEPVAPALPRVEEIEQARQRYLAIVDGLGDRDGARRPDPQGWSVAEITEHLVLAERMGVHFVWTALDAARRGEPLWDGEHENLGQSIEEVIERTWKPREVAPEPATPSGKGPLSLWAEELRSLASVTGALGAALAQAQQAGLELTTIVYPHFLCGSLDADQRLQFIRFHLDRHASQADRVRTETTSGP